MAQTPPHRERRQDQPPGSGGRVAILYHVMYPDDVVSAHHFDGLAQGLASHGWAVEALPANRGCRDETRTYPRYEVHAGVAYRRIWRPRVARTSYAGRLLSAAWMVAAWTGLALRRKSRRPDLVIVGTDPIFAVTVAVPLKLLAPGMRIAHWCFDLHPEAAVANGVLRPRHPLVRLAQWGMGRAYRRCDLIADLGACMRRRLDGYDHGARRATLPVWALSEPERPLAMDSDARRELFGDAQIGILYSGNFGEAHSYEAILALARALRHRPEIHFCFAVRGHRAEALEAAIGPQDTNISLAAFAPLDQLEQRLGAADIHLASLNPAWAGLAVPSKFQGSLAAGRPVIFAGPRTSAIGDWIERYDLGWVLGDGEPVAPVAEALIAYIGRPEALAALQAHCHDVYARLFARRAILADWSRILGELLAAPAPSPARPAPERSGE